MRARSVHLSTGDGRTACHRRAADLLVATDARSVTCGKCRARIAQVELFADLPRGCSHSNDGTVCEACRRHIGA